MPRTCSARVHKATMSGNAPKTLEGPLPLTVQREQRFRCGRRLGR